MKRILSSFIILTVIVLAGIVLFTCGNDTSYYLVYIFTFLFIACYAVFSPSTIPSKIVQVTIYALVMVSQILFCAILSQPETTDAQTHYLCRLLGVLAASLPVLIRFYFFNQITKQENLPSPEEHTVISYSQLLCNKNEIFAKAAKMKQAGHVLSGIEWAEMIHNIPRHSSFSYVNHGTLTDAYFQKASETLNNGYIYIVVTKTKSVPSDVIGLFTNREFNHVSLSFDAELKTIISYNGGDRASPPGLNAELLQTLTQRNGSAVIVYRLPASAAQKKIMLQKIQEIDSKGSAYNLLGLVLKTSQKPNIMFCSQFVYTLLKLAELNYFEKKPTLVTPTDFIELDYDRNLRFVYKIVFNHVTAEHKEKEIDHHSH